MEEVVMVLLLFIGSLYCIERETMSRIRVVAVEDRELMLLSLSNLINADPELGNGGFRAGR